MISDTIPIHPLVPTNQCFQVEGRAVPLLVWVELLELHGLTKESFFRAMLQTEGYENKNKSKTVSTKYLESQHYIIIADLCMTVPYFDDSLLRWNMTNSTKTQQVMSVQTGRVGAGFPQ